MLCNRFRLADTDVYNTRQRSKGFTQRCPIIWTQIARGISLRHFENAEASLQNLLPFDPLPPAKASGIRVGTPCVATQGMGVAEMDTIADMIDLAVTGDEADRRTVRGEVSELVERFPVYPRPAS